MDGVRWVLLLQEESPSHSYLSWVIMAGIPPPRGPRIDRTAMANIRSIRDRSPGDNKMIIGIRGANHYSFSSLASRLCAFG